MVQFCLLVCLYCSCFVLWFCFLVCLSILLLLFSSNSARSPLTDLTGQAVPKSPKWSCKRSRFETRQGWIYPQSGLDLAFQRNWIVCFFHPVFRCISAAVKHLIVTNRILHPPLPQSLVECIYEHQKTAIASVQFLLCHFEDRLLNVNCHDKYCVNCKL